MIGRRRTGRGRCSTSLLVGGAALAALACGAPPAEAADDRPPVVAVTGEGAAAARPDTAEVRAGVVTQASTAALALSRNSEAMARVFEALEEAGIAGEDVQTEGLFVTPRRRQPGRDEPRSAEPDIVGYEVTNRVRVVVRDLSALGGTLDALVRAGANTLDGVAFSLADPSEPGDRARRAAMADARRRASLYAEEAGGRLGPVLRVEEQAEGGFEPRFQRFSMAQAESVPTAPGTLDFTARVRVVYALER